MQTTTTIIGVGLDGKPHHMIVETGKPGWPLACCGVAEGSGAKQAKLEAEFFASATSMYEIIEALTKEFCNINPDFPLSEGKIAELHVLIERSEVLVSKFKNLRF